MIKEIQELYEWAKFELLDVQFCDNTWRDAQIARKEAEAVFYALCLKFNQMLLDERGQVED